MNAMRGINRDKAMSMRHGKHWCLSCDMCLIGHGQKCPVCGNRSKKTIKRLNKAYIRETEEETSCSE